MLLNRWYTWLAALLMLSSYAWARGGGARPAASHWTAQPRPAQISSNVGTGTRHANFLNRRRGQFLYGNGAVIYPWWYAYGPDDPDVSSPYLADNTPSSSVGDTLGTAPSTPTFDSNFNSARETMDSVGARAAAQLYSSPQWESAAAELKQATAELAAAKDRIAQGLNARPDYRAALDQKQQAQNLAADLHERGASIDQVWPVAMQDLQASTIVTRLQREAMASDPDVIQAQARLQAAVAARRSLQEGLRAQIMNDPQWQQARQELDPTR